LCKKTAIRVASLNMDGFGSMAPDAIENKWCKIYRLMKENRIGVLLLQETHLTEDRVNALHKLFASRVRIYFSAHPELPTRRNGVAFVLNKSLISTSGVTAVEIIPGRALQLTIKSLGGSEITLLNIYAPSSEGAQARTSFFQQVGETYLQGRNIARPQLMAGDFNNIEDVVDRLPASDQPDSSIMALDDLKVLFNIMMTDGWRETNPHRCDYTFHRKSGDRASLSRLDRIYTTQALYDTAYEWKIEQPALKTDHCLISVKLTSELAPEVGKGRPVFPLRLLRDKKLAKAMHERGLKAREEIVVMERTESRTQDCNPQTVMTALKRDWLKMAREREKQVIPTMMSEMNALKAAADRTKQDRNMSDKDKALKVEAHMVQIERIKLKLVRQSQERARALHRIEGERPTKYWTKLHKKQEPREIIHAFEIKGSLSDTGEPTYQRDSRLMAEMAREHHDEIQADEDTPRPGMARTSAVQEVLQHVCISLDEDQQADLRESVSNADILTALRSVQNGSAAGADGIQYEVWKTLNERFKEDKKHEGRTPLDVVDMLRVVYDDVESFGVAPGCPFSEGLMCPLYKQKGERTNIASYRPITLLNTDYKLLTKVLAKRL
ncbi:Endonuclease/exonuclease/phosphatase, partial [Dichomitus squalens]